MFWFLNDDPIDSLFTIEKGPVWMWTTHQHRNKPRAGRHLQQTNRVEHLSIRVQQTTKPRASWVATRSRPRITKGRAGPGAQQAQRNRKLTHKGELSGHVGALWITASIRLGLKQALQSLDIGPKPVVGTLL
jgi:hypothetical protein